mmetsp:Transcript_5665/g.18768  ORF Transcript_5665/g.18768 Transcript_5665/m.18768 type:complete len:205 (-) Transcript_5665:2942-3556(-)
MSPPSRHASTMPPSTMSRGMRAMATLLPSPRPSPPPRCTQRAPVQSTSSTSRPAGGMLRSSGGSPTTAFAPPPTCRRPQPSFSRPPTRGTNATSDRSLTARTRSPTTLLLVSSARRTMLTATVGSPRRSSPPRSRACGAAVAHAPTLRGAKESLLKLASPIQGSTASPSTPLPGASSRPTKPCGSPNARGSSNCLTAFRRFRRY